MILITGATGVAGGAVLAEMRKTGKPIRAMYRSPKDAEKAPTGVQAAIADFSEPASMSKALEGVEAVFLVCSPIPQLVELESNAIDACAKAGVRHVVLNSALGASKYNKSFPSWHYRVEQKLAASPLKYTILRPNGFYQNLVTYNSGTIREQGAFYGSQGGAKVSLLDVRDVGAAAARALLEPKAHEGKAYELNGPEALSNTEVAERISRAAGRAVKYVDIPEEAQRQAMVALGMPGWQVDALLELQQYYASGKCGESGAVLEQVLGRPALRIDAYLEQNKNSFRGAAAGA
jgi:uncharacterized protein YbjT (DUF2867 family)